MPTGVYKRSTWHRRKISEALKGKKPKNYEQFRAASASQKRPTGEGVWNWKGDDVGYGALHAWLRRTMGEPSKCEECGTTEAGRYEWANINGKYTRSEGDWKRLCVSCHRKRDAVEPWNKGLRVQCNTGRTHIKPGQRISRATEFKKGHAPANQYLEPRRCVQCGKLFQPREWKRKFCTRRCYWDSMFKA